MYQAVRLSLRGFAFFSAAGALRQALLESGHQVNHRRHVFGLFLFGSGFALGFAFDQLLHASLILIVKFLGTKRLDQGFGELLTEVDLLLLEILYVVCS